MYSSHAANTHSHTSSQKGRTRRHSSDSWTNYWPVGVEYVFSPITDHATTANWWMRSRNRIKGRSDSSTSRNTRPIRIPSNSAGNPQEKDCPTGSSFRCRLRSTTCARYSITLLCCLICSIIYLISYYIVFLRLPFSGFGKCRLKIAIGAKADVQVIIGLHDCTANLGRKQKPLEQHCAASCPH